MSPLEHAIAEQRKCADYRGPDTKGALHGLHDWMAEEVLIRLEMDMPQQPKMTIEDLRAQCPLVEIEATMEKVTGRRDGMIVVQISAAHVNSGTMRKFQAAYEKAVNAGLIRGAA